MNDIAIIIPTYNAGESIVPEIKEIKRYLPHGHIIVVDDSSPDNTAEIVKTAFRKDKIVSVITRKGKQGRGSAVIAGFREALRDRKIEHFIEMDADLCHDPKYISEMIKTGKTADIIIASKYHPHSTIQGLRLKRILMSRLMNFCARLILRVNISDYTNGYRCYNRQAVEYITKQHFTSRGFVVLSEIIYRCHKKGFNIKEIPFDFRQVSNGSSNLNVKEISEAVITLVKLRVIA